MYLVITTGLTALSMFCCLGVWVWVSVWVSLLIAYSTFIFVVSTAAVCRQGVWLATSLCCVCCIYRCLISRTQGTLGEESRHGGVCPACFCVEWLNDQGIYPGVSISQRGRKVLISGQNRSKSATTVPLGTQVGTARYTKRNFPTPGEKKSVGESSLLIPTKQTWVPCYVAK